MAVRARFSTDRVPVKTSPTQVLMDVTTGELTPIVEIRGKFFFPGGFGFMGMDYNQRLRLAKLPADGYRLALLLMEKGGFSGICAMPYKELAATLEIYPSRVSKLLAQLEKVGVVQRIGNRQSGTIMINPTWFFQGTSKEQDKAMKMWSENRPYKTQNRMSAKV